jgi:DNA mismatch repair protein MutS2
MERIANSKENASYMQEPIVTQRSGRYVILLKADNKGKIPGIVHDQSASGMTLYVEPTAAIDLGNRWRQSELEAKREEERILSELSVRVAENASALRKTVRALGELDLALAKARYSREIRGIEAQLIPDTPHESKGFHLIGARHPLLKGDVVPIDIELGKGFTVLVITGPNTGGKTVTLKSVGIMLLMAQAGLHIPAKEGSRLSVFGGIYADIGDEQSIEQSLSTFSSHMTNIISILEQADSNSIVLLDELGAGTDPTEGSALGQALLSHLLERSIPTVATTHYPELKAYAHVTSGVENASVEFDAETLVPTYKVKMGLPGRSNALAIAQRLGLPQSVIEGARQATSQSRVLMESLLADIKVSREEALAAEVDAKLALKRTTKQQEELEARRLDNEAAHRELLEEEQRRVREQLREVRERMRRLERNLQMGTPVAQDVREAKGELDELASQLAPLPAASPSPSGKDNLDQFQPGDWVSVDELGQEGELLVLSNGEAEVRIGNFRVRVDASKMRLNRSVQKTQGEHAVSIKQAAKPLPQTELDLRGLRSEDALARLDKHLDEAYLTGLPWIRIIHGKGTGVLRKGVRELLEGHPLVSSHRSGDRKEGGDGVTIATLVGSA